MSEENKNTVIFENETFTLSEFCCSSDCVHKKHEEVATENEIVFPQKGYFQCRNSLGITQGDPNHVLFFNKDQPFEIEHPLGGGDICTVFSVKPLILNELLKGSWKGGDSMGTQFFRRNHQKTNFETSLKHSMLRRAGKNILKENILGFEEAVLEFLGSLFEQKNFSELNKKISNKKATRKAHKDLVERTIQYLNNNFCTNFTISALAKEVFSSPFHLCRVFREETEMTLHRYISGLRLKTALKELRQKNMSLTELALDLGYSSHSHFTSSFQQAFSLSPKEFRSF